MSTTRRQFLSVMGATAVGYGLVQSADVLWEPQAISDPGWSPGLENHANSTCLICPARCGIRARLVDERLVQIGGSPLHPVNAGGLCPRGIAGVQMLYHPERLTTPLARVGDRGSGDWAPITWDEALSRVIDRLRTLRADGRPEALALLTGYCAGSMDELFQRFMDSYGSPNRIREDYPDGMAAVMELMHGIPRMPGYDLERSDFVASFGAPLFEGWWSPLQAFAAYGQGAAFRNGPRGRLTQIDTRFSRTASRAQDWIGIHPGTHAVFALGVAYVLIRDELINTDFIARRVSGFDDYTDAQGRPREGYRSIIMRTYRTEEVSARTGVPVEQITDFARAFARSQTPVAVCGTDVTHAPNGVLAALAVHSLNVLVGAVNRPGGVMFGDALPVDPMAPVVDDRVGVGGRRRDPVAGAPAPFGNGNAPRRFAERISEASDAPIEALFVYYANPVRSSARPDAWRQTLERVPFIVDFSPFHDETTAYADLILPDLLAYERWQDGPVPVSYPTAVWSLAHPIVTAPAGPRHTGDVMLALARELGGVVERTLPYDDMESVLKAKAQGLYRAGRGMVFGNDFERLHHRAMQARGWWLSEHDDFDAFWDAAVDRGGWMDSFHDFTDPAGIAQTPDGRIHLMPAAVSRPADGETARLYVDIALDDTPPGDEYPLRLMPYRLSTLSSGTLPLERWLAERPGLLPDVLWRPWVEIAHETAHALGLHDGHDVWVVSPAGRYRAQLQVYAGAAPGTVGAPYGLRHPDGTPANPFALLDGGSDVLSGLPSWFTTFVRLEHA